VLAWVLAVLLLVDLSPTFQNASAFGRAVGEDLIFVDVQVEVDGSVTTVVAHFIDPGDQQQTVALINRGGAFWGGGAEVERANLLVVFEALRPDGSSEQSPPTDLVSMGVDPRLLGVSDASGSRPEDGDKGGPFGLPTSVWLVVAAVAAALSALAFWARAEYPKRKRSDPEGTPGSAGG
jgi:hypothetical protein